MQISKIFGRQANTKENIFEMNSHRSTEIGTPRRSFVSFGQLYRINIGRNRKNYNRKAKPIQKKKEKSKDQIILNNLKIHALLRQIKY